VARQEQDLASATPAASAATGTTGTAAQVYKLTANEGKASQFVGKRVEITGTLRPTEPAGASTRRPTPGEAPEVNVFAGEDLRLRELEVTSVRAMAGACPAK
jgi:hypothetical protein